MIDERELANCVQAEALYRLISSKLGSAEISNPPCVRCASMQFIVAGFLFVVVVGLIDRHLPWPQPPDSRS
jgi:hypothetical protein